MVSTTLKSNNQNKHQWTAQMTHSLRICVEVAEHRAKSITISLCARSLALHVERGVQHLTVHATSLHQGRKQCGGALIVTCFSCPQVRLTSGTVHDRSCMALSSQHKHVCKLGTTDLLPCRKRCLAVHAASLHQGSKQGGRALVVSCFVCPKIRLLQCFSQ